MREKLSFHHSKAMLVSHPHKLEKTKSHLLYVLIWQRGVKRPRVSTWFSHVHNLGFWQKEDSNTEMLRASLVLSLQLQATGWIESCELTWKTIQSTHPTWHDSYLKDMKTVHIWHSCGEPTFLLPCSIFRVKVTADVGLQRGKEREGPLSSHWASNQL